MPQFFFLSTCLYLHAVVGEKNTLGKHPGVFYIIYIVGEVREYGAAGGNLF